MKNGKRILKYNVEETGNDEKERINLRLLIGGEMIVRSVRISESQEYGQFVILRTEDRDYYTFSKKVLAIAPKLAEMLQEYDGVMVKVGINKRGQVYLSAPDEEI